jgi:hypothetical protein
MEVSHGRNRVAQNQTVRRWTRTGRQFQLFDQREYGVIEMPQEIEFTGTLRCRSTRDA